MSNQLVKVKRDTIAACMTCPLCHKLFRDATTISECLHTFCRKCIYKKLSDEETEHCPTCNIDLGCVPLEKLRPDHNLQDVRAKVFPYKRRKVNAPEIVPSVALPVRRKERSLSSLVVSTPRVSSQTGITGRRTKSVARKTLRGSNFSIEKPLKKEEGSEEDQLDSSSSLETLNKFTQNIRLNSSSAEPSSHPTPDKETENGSEQWEGKVDLWKPLNCLVEAANRSKSSRFTSHGSTAKLEGLHSHDREGHVRKTKVKEHGQKLKIKDDNNSDPAPPEFDKPKKSRRIRQKKASFFGEFDISPQTVLGATTARCERRIYPIWFSLVASEDQEGDAPLPQISASYLRIKYNSATCLFLVALGKSQSRCIKIENLLLVYDAPQASKFSGFFHISAATDLLLQHVCTAQKFLQCSKDGNIPVSFIQKYLMRKLDLKSEDEVEIRCMGQSIIPSLPLNSLVDMWLQTTPSETIPAIIGSSAKDFVMGLAYARKIPGVPAS